MGDITVLLDRRWQAGLRCIGVYPALSIHESIINALIEKRSGFASRSLVNVPSVRRKCGVNLRLERGRQVVHGHDNGGDHDAYRKPHHDHDKRLHERDQIGHKVVYFSGVKLGKPI